MKRVWQQRAANQVVVTVIPSQLVLVPTQTQTMTANVTGPQLMSLHFRLLLHHYSHPDNCRAESQAFSIRGVQYCQDRQRDPAVGTLSNIVNTSTTSLPPLPSPLPRFFPDQTSSPTSSSLSPQPPTPTRRKRVKPSLVSIPVSASPLLPPLPLWVPSKRSSSLPKDSNGLNH